MRIKCPACGDRYHIHETHVCTEGSAVKGGSKINTVYDAQIDRGINERKYNRLIGLRVSDDMLKKLDEARGAATRPAKIREILEREL